MRRQVTIAGTGVYLPGSAIQSTEIDARLGVPVGWTEKKSGVKTRYYANGEAASEMGAKAAQAALTSSGMELADIDCIVSVSGTMEQPIPCNASLIHQRLKPVKPIPAFDINSTCLSFVTGLDLLSHLVHSGAYKNVLLISSEIASIGINPNHKESYVLFGDAAAACIITHKPNTGTIIASRMETYSEGARLTEIRGGGTNLHPNHHQVKDDYLFDMNGKEIFRLSSKHITGFIERLFMDTGLSLDDIDVVIPHQASGMAMRLLRGKLGIPEEKFISIIADYGNTIAASIPLALHVAISQNRLRRGQSALLIGTSAGLSLGGVIFEY